MSVSNILRTRFIIKKDKAKDNLAPVYVRIAYGASSVDLPLNYQPLDHHRPARIFLFYKIGLICFYS
jgi:hypothetical protein